MAPRKYIRNSSGVLTEEAAIASSAGAGDEGKIPALDAAGLLSQTMMPVGIAPDTASIVSSENLAAGDVVNVWDDAGTPKVRKADATTAGKEAHGFVLEAVTAPASATVYFEGSNTGVSGLTAGVQFLQTTAGQVGPTAPSGSGNVVQRVGVAVAAAKLNFEPSVPITLV